MTHDVFLSGVGGYVPERLYSNEEICQALELPPERARRYGALLGVRRRPLCIDLATRQQVITGEELAYRAAVRALAAAELEAGELDAVICTSSFFDYLAPALSSRLLKRLELRRAITFDLIGGCAEFLHGLQIAANMIRLGQARHVLVTASEVIAAYWRQIRYPMECFIFGDTGGAMVLGAGDGTHRLVDVYLSTDSHIDDQPAELICVPIIGGKEPAPLFYDDARVDPFVEAKTDVPAKLRLVHDIHKIAIGAPRAMIEATTHVLGAHRIDPDSVFLVPHQASIGVLSALIGTGVPMERVGVSLRERGNMSTASLPVTLWEHWDDAVASPNLVMTSVGVGVSYGAGLFERTAAAVPRRAPAGAFDGAAAQVHGS